MKIEKAIRSSTTVLALKLQNMAVLTIAGDKATWDRGDVGRHSEAEEGPPFWLEDQEVERAAINQQIKHQYQCLEWPPFGHDGQQQSGKKPTTHR